MDEPERKRLRLPKRLRHATPEEIVAYRIAAGRRAVQSREEFRTIFRQRMQRNGREEELDRRIATERDNGKSRQQAVYAAMRDMGYRGANHERKLCERDKARGNLDRRRANLRTHQKKRHEKILMEEFEEAIKDLPGRAPIEQEMDWVRVHPAMTRKKRQEDKTQPVEVTRKDILEAGHGKAPSQYAANMLMYWVDNPGDFFKLMASEDKKEMNSSPGGATSSSKETVADDGISNLKRVHAQFLAQRAAKS